nr:unnamed protein product [Callosobruchus chinensis]
MHQHHTASTPRRHTKFAEDVAVAVAQTNEKRGANAARIGYDKEARTPIASRSLS